MMSIFFKKEFSPKSPLKSKDASQFFKLSFAILKARLLFSIAIKVAFFNSFERDFVIAPEPQPRSAITGFFIFDEILMVSSTRNSVSALGMRAPFLTKTSML